MADFTPDQQAKVQARILEMRAEAATYASPPHDPGAPGPAHGRRTKKISRLEHRADLLLSTLTSYVTAMGGKRRLIAEFPDRPAVAIALAKILDAATPTRQPTRLQRRKPGAINSNELC